MHDATIWYVHIVRETVEPESTTTYSVLLHKHTAKARVTCRESHEHGSALSFILHKPRHQQTAGTAAVLLLLLLLLQSTRLVGCRPVRHSCCCSYSICMALTRTKSEINEATKFTVRVT